MLAGGPSHVLAFGEPLRAKQAVGGYGGGEASWVVKHPGWSVRELAALLTVGMPN